MSRIVDGIKELFTLRPIPLISNNTPFEIKIYEGYGGVFREWSSIPAGEKLAFRLLGREFECRSSLDKFESVVYATASDEDLNEVAEIRFIYQTQDNILTFDVIPRGLSKEDLAIVKPVKDRVSSKIGEASRSSIKLRKLCNTVKLCRNQCDHLVEACEKGIQKMMQSYSRVAEDPPLIWRFYKAGRLAQLYNSLDSLDFILCDVKDLLEACAEELGWVALVVSMPMPPVTDKKMEACSTFDLLVGELMWHLDCITCIIEHPLQRAGGPGVKLEWCPIVHRYVLIRTDESRNDVIAGTESAVPKPDTNEDVKSRAHADREELQSGLEDGSFFAAICRFALHYFRPHRKMLSDIIIKRCKVNMHPSMDIRSLSVDPECLRINERDVKRNPSSIVGSGSFKVILEGEWCGQTVVIAMLRDVRRDEFEKEVMHLARLQHPKVVRFFGWDYITSDAPNKALEGFQGEECGQGYIVTEKMDCDLEKLINTLQTAATVQKDSGGPFAHSVGLDILLQIVEAMLHVQNHGVMHRDLKPGNVLVNVRSSPRAGADVYYDVKLIDFGSSKVLGADKNTYNVGTTAYGAPEVMVGSKLMEPKGKYGPSVDVFSFAMTCYKVVTGNDPFPGFYPSQIRYMIQSGDRPKIPPTVLSGLKELMEDCWIHEPASRPTFDQIQERLWTIKTQLAVPFLLYSKLSAWKFSRNWRRSRRLQTVTL